uniref:ShKT domain-containing protein n=1 Tax=Corethron hystrix TaxID=216773 RepID=A0A7S1BXT0_9STRA|mmetsp:Transcript_4520/g.8790  ORF Transcript_4520/g.8790 Transcript_4520/m.8790 type:complete len:318 (+) Transcript_4520:316-1269(+)
MEPPNYSRHNRLNRRRKLFLFDEERTSANNCPDVGGFLCLLIRFPAYECDREIDSKPVKNLCPKTCNACNNLSLVPNVAKSFVLPPSYVPSQYPLAYPVQITSLSPTVLISPVEPTPIFASIAPTPVPSELSPSISPVMTPSLIHSIAPSEAVLVGLNIQSDIILYEHQNVSLGFMKSKRQPSMQFYGEYSSKNTPGAYSYSLVALVAFILTFMLGLFTLRQKYRYTEPFIEDDEMEIIQFPTNMAHKSVTTVSGDTTIDIGDDTTIGIGDDTTIGVGDDTTICIEDDINVCNGDETTIGTNYDTAMRSVTKKNVSR